MCGIVGFVSTIDNKQEIIQNMMDRIVHRGPDSSGLYTDDNIALGFRRLSIIDLEGGTQPIFNEDNTKVILFNGEVYNYQPLQKDLKEKGHVFTTDADTEVILHGYEEYGAEIVNKLRGMFTFVIWDIAEQKMFGARDHFGIKPFYYAQMNDTLMFGSEIKSFLEQPAFDKVLNEDALRSYMTFQYPATEETFFKGVFRVPEGHYFTYENQELTFTKYWDTEFAPENMSLETAIDMIDDAVKESVEAHAISDVKVGSFLSSGVDSSYVAAVLKPDITFSIGFGSKTFNESHEAKQLADKLGLNNKSKLVTGDEAFEAFPKIQYHLDEPDSNPSCVPLYFLTEMAREDVTVALSGEGADELFAGYQYYGFQSRSKAIRVAGDVLKKLPRGMKHTLGRGISKINSFPGKTHLVNVLATPEEFFIGQARVFEEADALAILQPKFHTGPSVAEILKEKFAAAGNISDLKKMQYVDLHQWMTKDILLKADKLSMAHSLELRVPLLDRKLMEVAAKIPDKYLMNSKNTKYAFRKAANKHLPDEWADREKLGFPVPIKDWLRDEKYYSQVKELFSQDFANEFFDQTKILKMLEDNFAEKTDDRRKLWNIYTFLVWYQVYFINDGVVPG